jgi:hypothetical protein
VPCRGLFFETVRQQLVELETETFVISISIQAMANRRDAFLWPGLTFQEQSSLSYQFGVTHLMLHHS